MKFNKNEVYNIDALIGLREVPDEYADIIIADPPYNIGKKFDLYTDDLPLEDYIKWCKEWISECIRILKKSGTMFIYGFSENLAYIFVNININKRWLIWYYTNKNVPQLNFWQRAHESIICCWKGKKPIFNRDSIREQYTTGFLRSYAGKERGGVKGRYGEGIKTTYNAHPNGAMPRDVIKVPALSGWSGWKERVDHPTQKPLKLCEILLKSARPEGNGMLVVPFVGSGSECVASKILGLDFLGFETVERYIKITNERLLNIPKEIIKSNIQTKIK